MKKILYILIPIVLLASFAAAGNISFGMTGAVKKRVDKLDQKVRDYKASLNTQTDDEDDTNETGQTGILINSTNFTGPYPIPSSLTFTDELGHSNTVDAYPGHVQVFFTTTTAISNMESIITAVGGTILQKIPAIGYYLIQVTDGTEASIIMSLNQNALVVRAMPNIVLYLDEVEINEDFITTDKPVPLNITGPVAIDSGDHALNVAQSAANNGAGITNIVSLKDILDENGRFASDKVTVTMTAIIEGNNIFNPNQPAYVNMSNGAGNKNDNGDWESVENISAERKQKALDNWKNAMKQKLTGISQLPEKYQEQLVVTQSAGNCNMDVSAALTELQNNSQFAKVLNNIFYITSTHLEIPDPDGTTRIQYPSDKFANYISGSNNNFVYIDNDEAAYGTSYGAPAMLAYQKQFIDLTGCDAQEGKDDFKEIMATGLSPQQALFAAEMAMTTNANNKYDIDEALDKAEAIKIAENDAAGAENVTAIAFLSKGSVTTAQITPAMAGVTVHYTVSGTDGYYDSGYQQTNASGQVTFNIPAGESGVTDTISVIAVLSGKYCREQYTW